MSVQSCVCVCRHVCAELPGLVTFPPLPQSCSHPRCLRHVTTISPVPRFPPLLPSNSQGLSKVCHKSEGEAKGIKPRKPHTHFLNGAGNGVCVQGRTGGGHAEELNRDEWRKDMGGGGGGGGGGGLSE